MRIMIIIFISSFKAFQDELFSFASGGLCAPLRASWETQKQPSEPFSPTRKLFISVAVPPY